MNQGAWQLYSATTHLNQGAWQGWYDEPTPPPPPPPPSIAYPKVLRQYKIYFKYFILLLSLFLANGLDCLVLCFH